MRLSLWKAGRPRECIQRPSERIRATERELIAPSLSLRRKTSFAGLKLEGRSALFVMWRRTRRGCLRSAHATINNPTTSFPNVDFKRFHDRQLVLGDVPISSYEKTRPPAASLQGQVGRWERKGGMNNWVAMQACKPICYR